MTEHQVYQTTKLVSQLKDIFGVTTAVHGDCVGADTHFHEICHIHGLTIHSRPCTITSKRAFNDAHHTYPPRQPLDRNRDIVAQADIMLATPSSPEEQLRSGTWATVRYARKAKKPLILIFPDGTLDFRNIRPVYNL